MKKILFNDKYGLTKAVLDGRKTQTRRVANIDGRFFFGDFGIDEAMKAYADFVSDEGRHKDVYPAYQPGETVAVAQSYRDIFGKEYLPIPAENEIIKFITDDVAGVWNKMFVKSYLMPHRIEFGDIRVERLQDISDEDCLKEGVMPYDDVFGKGFMLDDPYNNAYRRHCFTSPRKAFAFLVDKICGKETWDKNPWVFVYDFKLAI